MVQRRSWLGVARMVVACLLITISLGSCVVADLEQCSESNLAKTDRAADQVWQVIDSSEPDGGAYCDSSPYPYASGSMDGPTDELVTRASKELGCKPTTLNGFDGESTVLLACDIEGDSYVLEIAREIDAFRSSPGLEVGLYKR